MKLKGYLLVGLFFFIASLPVQSEVVDFNPSPNGRVAAIALQDDGKIFIAGSFKKVGNVARIRIARLKSNGDLDLSFINSGVYDTTPGVDAVAIQSDGRLIVGGTFTKVGINPRFARNNIARLNTDGSVDPNFNPNVRKVYQFVYKATIYALLIQGDGKIIIGGNFSEVGGVAKHGVARLNTDGSVDTSFGDLGSSSATVYAMALQDDGKIIISGYFHDLGGVALSQVARLNIDGSVDTTFKHDLQFDHSVQTIAIQENGGIIIGGEFNTISNHLVSGVARLEADGSLDEDFIQSLPDYGNVQVVALQADGKIVFGGRLEGLDVNGVETTNLARLHENGNLDIDFNPVLSNAFIKDLVIQDDDKILVGGDIDQVGLLEAGNIVRINKDGTVHSEKDICAPIKSVDEAFSLICL